ncbi:MAG: hypothetical protein U0T82_07720 [Bacteroidales bacterium]
MIFQFHRVNPWLFLFLFGIYPADCLLGQSTAITTGKKERIDSVSHFIQTEKRYVHSLDTAAFYNLPVGIIQQGQDPAYALMITRVTIFPGKALFDACMQITNPANGEKLAFEASDVAFSFENGLEGPFHLKLVDGCSIPFSRDIHFTILPGSWAEADCKGFRCLGLKGRLVLSSEHFIPVDEEGDTTKNQLTAFFETIASDWNDLVFSISLSPFRLKVLPDITFQLNGLTVDFSDLRNAAGLNYPEGYQAPFGGAQENLWRGLYAAEAKITLGKPFAKNDGTLPSFIAKNLLIDEAGFSGTFSATNLLGEKEGNMQGWGFSVSTFSASVLQNALVAGYFNGNITIPPLGENSKMAYQAAFDTRGNYSFSVNPADSFQFEMFGKTSMKLNRSSTILVEKSGNRFVPKAVFSGVLSFDCALDKAEGVNAFKIEDIRFQELCISAEAPFLSVKYLETAGKNQSRFSGFPLTIERMNLRVENNLLILSIQSNINLIETTEEGFSGQSVLSLRTEFDGKKFHYRGIEAGSIGIHFGKPEAFELTGNVDFIKDDPVYGNGFRGELMMTIETVGRVEARALFGRTTDTRYYFADALFVSENGIPAGMLTILGGGGGISHHMRQEPSAEGSTMAPSGIKYIPDKNTGLGVRLAVYFGLVNKTVMSAQTGFEINFNPQGGIARIGFDGVATCIAPEIPVTKKDLIASVTILAAGKKINKLPPGAIQANLKLEMDFIKKAFHGDMQVFVNVNGTITGTGPNGRAGWAVVHIDKNEWYLCIGTPQQPIGLQFAGIAKTASYLMAGHHVPEALPLNEKVIRILQLDPSDFCEDRNASMLQNGKGIAFGTNFEVSINEEFPVVYGTFNVGGGFDLLLNDFGENSYCAGYAPPIGINGWYAKGQVYAFLEGKIGIILTLFKNEKRKFDVLNLAAAALLRGEGPNPMWINGTVGGKFALLGGMVKGSCRFELTIGEKCKLVRPQGGPESLNFIGDISPGDALSSIDPAVTPQVVFNLSVNRTMPIVDDNGQSRKFRINLKDVSLTTSNNPVSGMVKWNDDQDMLSFLPDELLLPQTDYQFSVSVSFEEYKSGKWVAENENGVKQEESKACSFKTGDLPKEISVSEIAWSYPVMRQYHFLPKEYPTGYIHFTRGESAYFSRPGMHAQVRFIPVPDGTTVTREIRYDNVTKTAQFEIPYQLAPEKIYRLEVLSVPDQSDADKNITESYTEGNTGNEQDTLNFRKRQIDGISLKNQDQVFLQYYFRTSRFQTFKEKINVEELPVSFLYEISPYVNFLGATWQCTEAFDKAEISGTSQNAALVQRSAVPEKTTVYINKVYPVLYKDYPYLQTGKITSRPAEPIGIPPVKDILLWQQNYAAELSEATCLSGQAENISGFVHFMYTIPYYWSRDYTDIRTSFSNALQYASTGDERISAILKCMWWPLPDQGSYPVRIDYMIPGIQKISSTLFLTLQNPFRQSAPK